MVLTANGETLRTAPRLQEGPDGHFHLAFEAMGTVCKVDFELSSRARAETFKDEVLGWLDRFEKRFSRFVPDSLISRLNRAAGQEWTEIDDEAASLFALCDWFHWSTRGIFDPTSLPLVALWDYHVHPPVLPSDEQVRRAQAKIGWTKFRREGKRARLSEVGMGLDVGGIGKEYAVDRVMEMAARHGIANGLVDFGHDLRVRGEPPEGGPWRIGLEDPHDPARCWGGVAVRDRAVASSGDYFRNFEIGGKRYGHILDPRTGFPVHNGCRSVAVIAPTCTEAGLLSTTAFILGPRAGLEFLDAYYQAEGCLWDGTHRVQTRRFHEYLIP
jgi:thiamine biosynthesis lipoprotein